MVRLPILGSKDDEDSHGMLEVHGELLALDSGDAGETAARMLRERSSLAATPSVAHISLRLHEICGVPKDGAEPYKLRIQVGHWETKEAREAREKQQKDNAKSRRADNLCDLIKTGIPDVKEVLVKREAGLANLAKKFFTVVNEASSHDSWQKPIEPLEETLHRICVRLYEDGKGLPDIAKILGCNEQQVSSFLESEGLVDLQLEADTQRLREAVRDSARKLANNVTELMPGKSSEKRKTKKKRISLIETKQVSFEEVIHLLLSDVGEDADVRLVLTDRNGRVEGDTRIPFTEIFASPGSHQIHGPFGLGKNLQVHGSIWVRWVCPLKPDSKLSLDLHEGDFASV
jgi:hypothetical protein